MIAHARLIAKKYAIAFLNVYEAQLPKKYFVQLSIAAQFLKSHRFLLALLSAPSTPFEEKKRVIDVFVHRTQMLPCTRKLVAVVLKQGNIELLDTIFDQIILWHNRRTHEYIFKVTTSHPLSTADQQTIQNIMKKIHPNTITFNFVQNLQLVGGIRIKSDTMLWERSIAKQLRLLKRKLIQRERL